MDINLSDQQILEIKQIIKEMREDDIKDKCKTTYLFANKFSTEEMMMRLALSYDKEVL